MHFGHKTILLEGSGRIEYDVLSSPKTFVDGGASKLASKTTSFAEATDRSDKRLFLANKSTRSVI